jgi:hypothetical protein
LEELKLDVRIFRLFHSAPQSQISARGIYLGQQALVTSVPADIQESERQKIHESLLRLQNKGLIAPVPGTDSFQITGPGKSTYPELLIWERQKHDYDKLTQTNRKRRFWSRLGDFVYLGGIFAGFSGLIIASMATRGYGDLWVSISLMSASAILIFVGLPFTYWRISKFIVPSEDRVFIRMWEAYDLLLKYESEKKQEYLKQCTKRLEGAARVLRRKKPASTWDLVEKKIYVALRELGNYTQGKIMPAVGKNEIRKALSDVSQIGSLLLERDVSGILKLSEDLGPTKVLAGWRAVFSWTEIRAKPLVLAITLILVSSLVLVGGFFAIRSFLSEPTLTYALIVFTTGFATSLMIFIEVYLRRG